MSLARICQHNVDVAREPETAWQAAERMHQRTVGTLVVVDRSRKPVGILTDRDLVVRVLAAGKEPHSITVGEVMTRNPEMVTIETPIDAVLSIMRNGAFRRVPVVAADGTLAGLVSLDDILLSLADEFTRVGELLEAQNPSAVQAH